MAEKLAVSSVSPPRLCTSRQRAQDTESGGWQCFVPTLIQLGHDRELSGRGPVQGFVGKWPRKASCLHLMGVRIRDQGQALPIMLPRHLPSLMVPPGLVALRPCSHPSPTKGNCFCRKAGGAEGSQSSYFPLSAGRAE